MKLNYKEFGSGQPLLVLHGLFGSLDNWVTLGKKWAEHYHVFLIDERNHGQSPHHDEFSYEAMAEDIHTFIRDHNLSDVYLLGHSMGGKTAMVNALTHPEYIRKLIVVDMAPKSYQVHHRQILDGLLSLDFNTISSRSEADQQLAKFVPELPVRQFLLKNLYWKDKQTLSFRFNLPVINREIEPISQWKPREEQFDKSCLFIRGGQSNYLDENDESLSANFPAARLVTIPNAGHWVHAEAPQEFDRIVRAYLEDTL
jgi:pimeloyl-ACP methyl ester carboxylesterase